MTFGVQRGGSNVHWSQHFRVLVTADNSLDFLNLARTSVAVRRTPRKMRILIAEDDTALAVLAGQRHLEKALVAEQVPDSIHKICDRNQGGKAWHADGSGIVGHPPVWRKSHAFERHTRLVCGQRRGTRSGGPGTRGPVAGRQVDRAR